MPTSPDQAGLKIAAILPAYNSAGQIGDVLARIPPFVADIIVVDDCSPDQLASVVQAARASDPRIRLIHHERNRGVGGAMVTGYLAALEAGADILIKLDSDGQMDPADLPALIYPLITFEADYTKGNRFLHTRRLGSMPWVRRLGNIVLSVLSKVASGYWNIFDPTNGYTAIRRQALEAIDLGNIHPRYFFEISMLVELGMARAVVQDVYIPAHYGHEVSSLSEADSLVRFPPLLLKSWLRRILLQHFVRDFSVLAAFTITGTILLLFSLVYGGFNWFRYATAGIPAPTGTIMIAVLPLVLGFQFYLQAILMDIQNIPRRPISRDRAHQEQIFRDLGQ